MCYFVDLKFIDRPRPSCFFSLEKYFLTRFLHYGDSYSLFPTTLSRLTLTAWLR